MDLNQTYKCLKDTINKTKKVTCGLGENVSKWCNRQELNFQNIQEFIQFNNNNRKQWKNGQKT